MRKQNNLPLLSGGSQQPKQRQCALAVKARQQVISDEWHRLCRPVIEQRQA
jgi:hypothetical protein